MKERIKNILKRLVCTDCFKPRFFTAVEMLDDFMIGVYDVQKHETWKYMTMEQFEPVETDIFKKVIPHIDSFIDIGAYVGYYTCLVGTKKTIPTFSFEPNADNFKCLERNIAINKISHGNAYNVGLSDESGTADFYSSDAMGSIVKDSFNKNEALSKRTVTIHTLDSYSEKIPVSDKTFIKVDVEANEFQVLKGAKKFFQTHRPAFLLMEIVKNWGGGENQNFENTFKLLDELGYIPYTITNLKNPLKKRKSSDWSGGYFMIRKDLVDWTKTNIPDLLEE